MPRVEDPEFDTNIESLVKALVGNTAVAFVGAGIGMRVGYPTWGTLLDDLEELSIAANASEASLLRTLRDSDALVRAQEYKRVLGADSFLDCIVRRFGPATPPHDKFHEQLVSLPFRHVLTTNGLSQKSVDRTV
ncbi:MAG: hypothetical protein IID30_07090 [Planctomycetes bacterium]|nr:hypothetical protein [Planctomycetota bacterium]